MKINPEELTEHDKAMIEVAEKGDPNDPSEVKPTEEGAKAPELPEGVESIEDLIAKYNALNKPKEPSADGEEQSAEEESVEEETAEEEEGLSDVEIELRELKAYEAVGGKENYSAMVEYAKANLTEAQISVYDAAVNGADRSTALLAVQGLNAMYKLHQMETYGQEGQMTSPASGGLNVVQGYATMSDMMKDMSDPRYQTDPTFVANVERKLALSTF